MNGKKEKFQEDCSTHISRLNSNLKDILENLKIYYFTNQKVETHFFINFK